MRIDNIKLKLCEGESVLKSRAAQAAHIKLSEAAYFKVLKKSVDARDKGDVHFVYSVEIGKTPPPAPEIVVKKYSTPEKRVAVVGFGPAGIFCALALARRGFKPVVFERGESVDDRVATVKKFESTGALDTESNVQYGEGGAGAFSDGKLNTGVKSEYKKFILDELVKHGAPEQIAYEAKPHVGSDRLPAVVKSIREEIVSLGGEVRFGAKLTGVKLSGGKVAAITVNGEDIEVSELVLAIGHSARDTYAALFNNGFSMEQKDCAVGLRIEHLQEDINRAQYGRFYDNEALGSADYKLTSSVCPRGVFTFCMCPGGYVTAAASENGGVVTNGMSNLARDGVNANSAVVAQVFKSDYGEGALAGIDYIRKLERAAFAAGGGNYRAPVQLVGDFLNGRESTGFGRVKPTYPIGTAFCRLDKLLPDYIVSAIRAGIKDMDRRLKGFAAEDAVLTGIETRTSTPVRILRADNLAAVGFQNAYPCGETGYAGGIMSAAIDGLRVAEKLSEKYETGCGL